MRLLQQQSGFADRAVDAGQLVSVPAHHPPLAHLHRAVPAVDTVSPRYVAAQRRRNEGADQGAHHAAADAAAGPGKHYPGFETADVAGHSPEVIVFPPGIVSFTGTNVDEPR